VHYLDYVFQQHHTGDQHASNLVMTLLELSLTVVFIPVTFHAKMVILARFLEGQIQQIGEWGVADLALQDMEHW